MTVGIERNDSMAIIARTPRIKVARKLRRFYDKRKNSILKQIPNEVQIIITATSLVEIDKDIVEKANIISLKGDN